MMASDLGHVMVTTTQKFWLHKDICMITKLLSFLLCLFAFSDCSHFPKETQAIALHRSLVSFAPSVEAISTKLMIPAESTIKKHYHNGEEYLYIIKGYAFLSVIDEPEKRLETGTLTKIPYRKIHWARTGNDPVEAIIFRTHEKGNDVRVDVK